MSKKNSLLTLFLLVMFTSACKGAAVPQPTTDPGQVGTQVAEQVAAQLTQIALSQPTATMPAPTTVPDTEVPPPTATSLPLSEATATLEPASPTPLPPIPTNTSPAPTVTLKPLPTATTPPYVCKVTKQTPSDGKVFKPGDDFDGVWTVKNVGTHIWEKSEIDFKYVSGDIFHQIEIYDLTTSVEPGESVELVVDMKAPDKEGDYKTVWVLHQGKTFTCTLTLEISVKK